MVEVAIMNHSELSLGTRRPGWPVLRGGAAGMRFDYWEIHVNNCPMFDGESPPIEHNHSISKYSNLQST